MQSIFDLDNPSTVRILSLLNLYLHILWIVDFKYIFYEQFIGNI